MTDAFGAVEPPPYEPQTIPPPIVWPPTRVASPGPRRAPVERAARHLGLVMLGCTAALVWALLAATWVLVR